MPWLGLTAECGWGPLLGYGRWTGGGAGSGTRSSGTVVGPAGGTRSAGGGSGSYTTQRGTEIDYAGAGRGGTTPGGVNYGRGVGGVQVTTPGGKEVNKVGTAVERLDRAGTPSAVRVES